tara:strand:+ start:228 stop:539 length:312 start_codon:yes stop_codon:yes gene_type:complete
LDFNVYLKLNIYIKSVNLWTQKLTDYQIWLYKTIKELRLNNFTYKNIEYYFNNIDKQKSVRGKILKHNHIWSMEMKIDKHYDRLTTTYNSKIEDWDLVFENKM